MGTGLNRNRSDDTTESGKPLTTDGVKTSEKEEWDRRDSNPEPKDYESSALTD